MKKIFNLMLILMMCFSLIGCSDKSDTSNKNNTSNKVVYSNKENKKNLKIKNKLLHSSDSLNYPFVTYLEVDLVGDELEPNNLVIIKDIEDVCQFNCKIDNKTGKVLLIRMSYAFLEETEEGIIYSNDKEYKIDASENLKNNYEAILYFLEINENDFINYAQWFYYNATK